MMVIWIVIVCTLLSVAYAGECTEYYPCMGKCTESTSTTCWWCFWCLWSGCKKTTYYSCEKTCSETVCCNGYTGTGCNTPVCIGSTSCPNGSKCASPDRCTCLIGFSPNRCNDVNECHNNNGGCDHTCINSVGSYSCDCRSGYQLNSNGKTCSDINECSIGTSGCAHGCTNIVGSYTCSCNTGFVLGVDGKSCEDIDECIQSTSGCTQTCSNSDGSFECGCNAGYVLVTDAKTCISNYIVGVVVVICVVVIIMLLLCTILIRRYRQSAVESRHSRETTRDPIVLTAYYQKPPYTMRWNFNRKQDGTHAPSIQSNRAGNSGGSM